MAISRVKQLRSAIEKLTKWDRSGRVFGFIDGVKKPKVDYVYEFYCAMRILKDLSKYQTIKLEPGTNGYKFPRKPGKKAEWAKFMIISKDSNELLFQFCLGTNIRISSTPSTTFGADISLQKKDSPDDPDESDVVWIMDGKYKKSVTSKLDIGTIREFAQCVTDMEAPKRPRFKLQFDKLGQLNTNCLLSNAQVAQDHEEYCKKYKLKQVGKFNCYDSLFDVVG